MNRRNFLRNSTFLSTAFLPDFTQTNVKLVITDIEIHIVKVNLRGNWYFVELKTNKGLTGLGEASHGFALKDGDSQLLAEIKSLFELVKGESPFSIEQFRKRGLKKAIEKGKTAVTAWDTG